MGTARKAQILLIGLMQTESLYFRAFKGDLSANKNLPVFGNCELPQAQTPDLEYNGIELNFGLPSLTLKLIAADSFFAGSPKDKNTLVLASHSHSAPPLTFSKPEMAKGDVHYINGFNKEIENLKGNFQLGFIRSKLFNLSGAISRRSIRTNPTSLKPKAVFAPAPENSNNGEARLLEFCSSNGEVLALVFIWACHPIAKLPYQSPDFIGYLRRFLRNQYNRHDLPILFWQGAAGDIRPDLVTYDKTWAESIRIQGPVFSKPNQAELSAWWNEREDELLGKLPSAQDKLIEPNNIVFKTIELPLENLISNYKGFVSSLQISYLGLGTKAFLFLSAEPLSGWQTLIKNTFTDLDISVIGYTNDCFGYLPTQKDIESGGYEVYGFMEHFGVSGHWKADFEEIILNGVKSIVNI